MVDPNPHNYERYEEGSWDAWESTILAHKYKTSREDFKAFLPSPHEIEERKAMLLWLQMKSFSDRFICSVMQHDHPGIGLVMRFVKKYGPEETERRLEPFLPETEYDNAD